MQKTHSLEPQSETSQTWHQVPPTEVATLLATDLDHGLSPAEAETRLLRCGPNTITPAKGPGALRRAFSQFNQPLVIILIAAGAITAALRQWVDAGVIFGVVIINAIMGYLQESKAVRAIEALSRSLVIQAVVVRDGQRVQLPASELVPGDLVVLQAGDKVPADLRLTYVRDLRVDESALTGESVPVDKTTGPLPAETPLADRVNMAYATSLVTGGQGEGVVVATGDATEVGRISRLIAGAKEIETPLTRKIARFSRLLLFVILGLAAVTALAGVVRGQPLVDMFLAAVALAVGAIPEGLPAAVTITLAIGVSRMARRQAIIRKLPAVETLGSTTVICSDKTGTLTENQMTVQQVVTMRAVPATPSGAMPATTTALVQPQLYALTGSGYVPKGAILDPQGEPLQLPTSSHVALVEVLRTGLLCNDASLYREDGHWRISGDPTEGALLVSAAKGGLDREALQHLLPRVDTVPFESEHQYMATLHRVAADKASSLSTAGEEVGSPGPGDQHLVYVKGAVEKVVARCSNQLLEDGTTAPLEREKIEETANRIASAGLRVLAFARKFLPGEVRKITHADLEEDLTFLGLQGMIDPPREEAIRAIAACHTAGIQVKMVTGDHASTAAAIARRLNLRAPGCQQPAEDISVLTGLELAALDDTELAEAVEETYVFARVAPEQKLRLVTALQGRGHIVAMTGDGVNDGPALRQADIGVAMGITGTEVAKEAADMVLTDDNFASIEAAVEEGRGVFDNLKKFIAWTIPTNLGEGLVILVAVFAGVALPILPVQILWINMTTAVLLGLVLAFEAKEPNIMERPPRPPSAPLLDGLIMGRIVIVGVLLLLGSFGLFEWAQRAGYSLAEARTTANNVFVFGEMFYLFNCRSLTLPSWQVGLRSNRLVLAGAGTMTALQLLYTYLPGMNRLFGTAPVPAKSWIWVVAVALAIHVIIEVEKAVQRWVSSRRTPAAAC